MISKLFIYLGVIFFVMGIFFFLVGIGGKLLPGDIVIKKNNLTIVIPLISMLIISIILSIILTIIGKIWK